jgi:hypothetical protein
MIAASEISFNARSPLTVANPKNLPFRCLLQLSAPLPITQAELRCLNQQDGCRAEVSARTQADA